MRPPAAARGLRPSWGCMAIGGPITLCRSIGKREGWCQGGIDAAETKIYMYMYTERYRLRRNTTAHTV